MVVPKYSFNFNGDVFFAHAFNMLTTSHIGQPYSSGGWFYYMIQIPLDCKDNLRSFKFLKKRFLINMKGSAYIAFDKHDKMFLTKQIGIGTYLYIFRIVPG
jgi:hypothetical protein